MTRNYDKEGQKGAVFLLNLHSNTRNKRVDFCWFWDKNLIPKSLNHESCHIIFWLINMQREILLENKWVLGKILFQINDIS